MTAGHADHFLSRLDRVSWQQLEFALALYNDAPMLQVVLSRVKFPPDAERVALSLDHPTEGPFVIVTRDAKFVTCLARGMKVSNIPIVPRSRIDAIIERTSAIAEASAAAARQAGGAHVDGVRALLRRVFEAGPFLAREELSLLLVLAPLVAAELMQEIETLLVMSHKIHGVISELPRVQPTQQPSVRYPDMVFQRARDAYLSAVYALGHTGVILGEVYSSHDMLDPSTEDLARAESVSRLFSDPLFHCKISDISVRSAWGAARVGKPLLTALRRRWQSAELSPSEIFGVGCGLLAIASRHSKLRAEALKTVSRTPENLPSWSSGFRAVINEAAQRFDTEASDARTIAHAKLHWGVHARTIPRGLIDNIQANQEELRVLLALVDEDPAAAALVTQVRSTFASDNELTHLFDLVSYFARRPAERMYLPRASIVQMRSLEHSARSGLENHLGLTRKLQQRLVQSKPDSPRAGRNDPCPCKSGKKFKKCCGA